MESEPAGRLHCRPRRQLRVGSGQRRVWEGATRDSAGATRGRNNQQRRIGAKANRVTGFRAIRRHLCPRTISPSTPSSVACCAVAGRDKNVTFASFALNRPSHLPESLAAVLEKCHSCLEKVRGRQACAGGPCVASVRTVVKQRWLSGREGTDTDSWFGAGMTEYDSDDVGGRPHRRPPRRRVSPAPFFLADGGGL